MTILAVSEDVWADVRRPGVRLHTIDDLYRLPDPAWLVEGALQLDTLALIHGPPGAGKTFLALDLALSVASGQPWLGLPTSKGQVVYLLAEGAGSLKLRVAAWETTHGTKAAASIRFAIQPVDLIDHQCVEALAAQLGDESLVVVDTLARCMSGDENSSRDMGEAVAGLDHLRERSGAAVVVVHHSRKSGDAERGSSALRGAVASQFKVEAKGPHVELRCEKQRDGEEMEPLRFRLDVVGESCVPRGVGKVGPELSPHELALLASLPREFGNSPARSGEWIAASGVPPRSAARYKKTLVDAGFVLQTSQHRNAPFCLTEAGRRHLAATPASKSP